MTAGQVFMTQRAERPVGMFFMLVLLVHLIDIFLGRMGAKTASPMLLLILYVVILPFIGALGPFRKDTFWHSAKPFIYLVVLGAISYGIPLAVYNYLQPLNLDETLITAILLFAPFYPFWIYFTHYEDLGKWVRRSMNTYITIWVILLIISNPAWFQGFSEDTKRYLGQDSYSVSPGALILAQAKKAWVGAVQFYNASTTQPKQFLNQSIQQATGDAYTARVDKNAKLKLGVTIDDLKTTQASFSTTDRTGVFTTLSATTIEDPLLISIDCTAKDPKGSVISPDKRRVSPDTKEQAVEVLQEETLDIDCDFEPGALPVGRNTLTVAAQFEATTLSYVKTYLMDRERLRELRAAKIDPFQQYGITDRAPVTVYTSGPVSIGMSFGTPPIGLDATQDEFVGTLGITLKNELGGKIMNLSKLAVFVPQGFQLTEISGIAATFSKARCLDIAADWCDDSVSNLYIIDLTDPAPVEPGKSLTVRARVRAHRTDYERLLGATPISTRFFKTAAIYTYRLEKSITIDVKAATTGTPGAVAAEKVVLVGSPIVDPLANEANISFVTNVASASEVKYCQGSSTATCTLTTSSIPTPTTIHVHHLDGLQSKTRYAYDLYGFSSACPNNRCKLGDQSYTFDTQ
ncbi:hypothetical protein HY493_02335 [Candidatus Woesearchaeota archaeon]|nr:hypothetical protein [Candidatus Woesearchaeota archaeon]